MTEQIEQQGADVLEGTLQHPSQMHRLFKTREAALDFAKFMREGDVLIQCGVVGEEEVWQLTYNKGE